MTANDERRAASRRLVPEVSTALSAAQSADLELRVWPPDWQQKQDIDYIYRSGSLLTSTADAQRVSEAISALGPLPGSDDANLRPHSVHSPARGITRFQVPVSDDRRTPHVLERLDNALGAGVVGHDHVFGVCGWVPCPASEPERAVDPALADDEQALESALWPPRTTSESGQGVHVSVVDTGLLPGVTGWAPWLTGVVEHSRTDIDHPDTWDVAAGRKGKDGFADPYAGHGSFIAGVIKCVAPQTDVVAERMFGTSGFVSESSMITQMEQGLSRSPDIISLSAGGYTRDDMPPVGLQTLWRERLSQQGGVVLVAAAGNNSSSRPFWPAAFDWAVAVGSMGKDGQQRSWFSNYGSWVDVYAPGEDIVNVYPQLDYRTVVGRRLRKTSAGVVKWSGTSFSTPIVSGLIAARMSRTGENGRQAAQSLLAAARGQFRPGIGPRLFP